MRSFGILIGVASSLFAFGCGNESADNPVATPEKVASQMSEAFKEAEPSQKQIVSVVSKALKEKQYNQAYVALSTLTAKLDLTEEQGWATHEAERSLHRALLDAASNGDKNAARLLQTMNMLRTQ